MSDCLNLPGALCIGCMFLFPVPSVTAQAEWLGNGDFQTLSPAAGFPPWVMSGDVHPVTAGPDSSNYAISGRGRGNVPAIASQFVEIGDPAPGPVRLVVRADVQRSGSLPLPIRFVVTPAAGLPTVMAAGPDIVPDDGEFHQVTAALTLPAAPTDLNLSIESVAGGATLWKLDNAAMSLVSLPFRTNPDMAPAGAVVQLTGTAIQPGMQVVIGGVPANTLQALPGQFTVQVPNAPPAAVPGAFVAITLTAGNGTTLTDPAAFRFAFPMAVESAMPTVVSASGGTRVRVTGNAFPADLRLIIPSQPLQSPVVPDFIESSGVLVFTVPPHPGPVVQWQLESPSRPPSPAAAFSLTMEAPPLISMVLPDTGPPGGGTAVTVQGTGFLPGARVFFDRTEALATTFLSPNAMQVVVPAHQMENVPVSIMNPSGVLSAGNAIFHYVEGVKGDVNGDNHVDLADVILALESVVNAAPPGPLNPASDVDGDARIGLPEAVAALRMAEHGAPGTLLLNPPELLLSASSATAGELVFATVVNGASGFEPFTVFWGDGDSQVLTEAQAAGNTPHVFRPGTFQVRLLCSNGFTAPVPVVITPALEVSSASLILMGANEDGVAVSGGSARLDPAQPAMVRIQLEAEHLSSGPQRIDGTLRISSPKLANAVDLAWQGEFEPLPGDRGRMISEVSLPLGGWVAPGEYYASLRLASAVEGTGVIPPSGVTISLSGYVTEEDCRELEREWQETRLKKAARVNECEELKKRLADCLRRQADLMAAKAAAQNALGGLDDHIAGKQADYDTLFNAINQFLSGVGTLASYPAGGAPAGGGSFVGARKGGASAGVGIQFGDAQDLIDRMDLYEKVNGHSIGKDLNKLRDCIAQIDGLKAQKAAKEAEIAALDAQLAVLAADIAAKEAALAACMADCAALEQELKDFAEAHAEKLKQLERQREAEDALGESERESDDAGERVGDVDDLADGADGVIDGRAGTPGETGADRANVEKSRDCGDIARQKLAAARAKQAEARAALAGGDTVTANQKTAEANGLIAEANQKLEEAEECIRKARSSALGRKTRECTDGDFVMGTRVDRIVWDSLSDIGLAPMGVKPEKWASTLKNAKGVLDGLKKFFELLGLIEEATDLVGVDIPIGGTVTPDPAETAEAIVNAWLEIFQMTQPYDVWAELTGHTEWSRTDRRCVNGCWTYEPAEGRENDTVKRRCIIGTIWGGTKAERKSQLIDIIKKVGPHFNCN